MSNLRNEINADAKLTPFERVCVGIMALWRILFAALIAALCGGCVYKGAKVTEGTDLAIGLNVPVSEGTLQLNVLNYLSGFRLGVDRNAIMRVKYTVAETNDYLGCVHTRVYKTVDSAVEPCETDSSTTNATVSETNTAD